MLVPSCAAHRGTFTPSLLIDLARSTGRLARDATQHYRRAFTRLLDVESNRIVHDEHHMLVAAIRQNDPDDAERE